MRKLQSEFALFNNVDPMDADMKTFLLKLTSVSYIEASDYIERQCSALALLIGVKLWTS